ncbi:hypothetical protein [Paenibacillus lemnae]|uniref:Uncharacterized protein n=1 Tax=Paenibacillus lemnae TaxID=1330551 RepID=A0A848M3M9_PAELE|nr:hypothetical protein [Paenibacillus lemnae]NMO95196.1 hypothetical protein [Paenibacillus lemnae]
MNSNTSLCDKIGQLSVSLAGLQQSQDVAVMDKLTQDISQLHGELLSLQHNGSAGKVEETRQELVQCRMELHRFLGQVSDFRSQTAESYRQILGERKETFEQLDQEGQKTDDPDAYTLRQLFRGMDEISTQIHRLNGAMLDAGHQMERGLGGSLSIEMAETGSASMMADNAESNLT